MAKCIPEDGGYFDPSSDEKSMFDALKRALPDDFIVFHSFHLNMLFDSYNVNENEIDFIVFHPNYGCLFIEGKNRTIGYDDEKNSWYFLKKGKKIYMEDPFTQVFTAQYNLFSKLHDSFAVEKCIDAKTGESFEKKLFCTSKDGDKIYYENILNHCKKMVAVWLPKYTKEEILNKDFYLGPSASKELILAKDHLDNVSLLKEEIIKLMEKMNKVKIVYKFEKIIDDASGYKNQLSKEEADVFINSMLTPQLNMAICSQKDFNNTYVELLQEQCAVLDFLKYQRTAAINGCSGTGKTLVAVERARRLSNEGKTVLFICYNRNLREWLNNTYFHLKNVKFQTLDSLGLEVCKINDIKKLSYFDFIDCLKKQMEEHTFLYKNIIVDEGQDFGKDKIEDAHSDDNEQILDIFSSYGQGGYGDDDTSFFIFYDKYQLVNSDKPPVFLEYVDSKLTLYKNCRNTKNIASTAFSVININPVMFDRAWDGDLPSFIYYDDHDDLLKKLEKTIGKISSDRKIISCAQSLKNSEIFNDLAIFDGQVPKLKLEGSKTSVYTSATCKGLEASSVLLIDVTAENFNKNNKAFYVGASRAKKDLLIFIKKVNVPQILNSEYFKTSFPEDDSFDQIANELHGIVK